LLLYVIVKSKVAWSHSETAVVAVIGTRLKPCVKCKVNKGCETELEAINFKPTFFRLIK